MKKLTGLLLASIIMLLFSVAPAAKAQSFMTSSGSITNGGTATITSKQHYTAEKTLSIQATVTKTSGTVAGNCVPQGTFDLSNYTNVSTDTLTLADQATNFKVWVLTDPAYTTYRVLCTGSGTMVAALTGVEHAK